MSTATKTRKSGALAEAVKLEREWGEAASAVREFGHRQHAKQTDLRALLERQNRRLHRVPGEFHHDGTPLPDTEAAETQAAIEALGQCDFTAEIEHAKRIERVARQEFEEFIRQHGAEVNEERRPEGEALLAEYRERASALADTAERVLAFAQRSVSFAGYQRIETRRVPGLDEAGNAARTTRAMAEHGLPLPLQELDR